jgi:hypothetical protein
MTPQRGPDGKFVSGNHGQPDAAVLSSGMPSPLAQAVADAIAKFEGAHLSPEALRELARAVHYARPDLRNYEPAEHDAAREQFAAKISECRNVLKRFEALVPPGRESEALAVLPEFVNTAYAALVRVDFQHLERCLINLIYSGNRLSHPKPPARSLDDWLRVAVSLGWHPDEINDMLLVELKRDESQIENLDTQGFVTTSHRQINRAQLRLDCAPREEP